MLFRSTPRFEGANNPMEKVNWDDAVAFCQMLSRREGMTYRLPTEAEWEYACGAGSQAAYCFGDDEGALAEYAWFDGNSEGKTHPVGQKKPNAWGLYDMHGNVWEWCADGYDAGYYAKSPAEDPKGPAADGRVLRGGSWYNVPGNSRSACRYRYAPSDGISARGCRVVVSAQE